MLAGAQKIGDRDEVVAFQNRSEIEPGLQGSGHGEQIGELDIPQLAPKFVTDDPRALRRSKSGWHCHVQSAIALQPAGKRHAVQNRGGRVAEDTAIRHPCEVRVAPVPRGLGCGAGLAHTIKRSREVTASHTPGWETQVTRLGDVKRAIRQLERELPRS
ncbi:hypothetical protein GCM10022381_33190 [Leifsonia kafniensis]|uniref:Uncharacterized protein n=1 Tax=Leifsonia kafniensis TaxID=475957 RepID=A0ABP7KV14_9MICO